MNQLVFINGGSYRSVAAAMTSSLLYVWLGAMTLAHCGGASRFRLDQRLGSMSSSAMLGRKLPFHTALAGTGFLVA